MTDDRDYVLSCLRRAAENDYSWPVSPSEAKALLAEIERLRDEAHTMRLWAEEAALAENLNAEDAKKERAAVVTFLRAHADLRSSHHHVEVVQEAADIVERGAHLMEDA